MTQTLLTTFKLKRGSAAQWAANNPVLREGEPGYETDTGMLKIGNGKDNYNTLPYFYQELFKEEDVIEALSSDDIDSIIAGTFA